jgi:hypothetical protein
MTPRLWVLIAFICQKAGALPLGQIVVNLAFGFVCFGVLGLLENLLKTQHL